jgi:hypothetical protein
MKKFPVFQPSFVTKKFFPNHRPDRINNGECFVWAYTAHLLFLDTQLWWTPCHAFIKYHGRFYDSEAHRGERNWQDLRANSCLGYGYSAARVTVAQFKFHWRTQPQRFGTSWEDIETKARQALRYGNP